MRKMTCLLAVFFGLFTSPFVLAQRRAEKLDSLFRQLGREGHFNGTVLVAERGKIIYHQSFGYADVPKQTPNSPADLFQTASISKTFTATAVLQLVEQNKVKLTDPFAKFFPDFPFPTITVHHLLSHTSGLPGEEIYEPLVRRQPDLIVTNQAAIPALRAWPRGLHFVPGTAWRYGNNNYILLVLLVERISRLPFAAYLQRHVFKPARMNSTYVQVPGRPAPAHPRRVTEHLLPALYSARPEPLETVQLQDTLKRWHMRFLYHNLSGLVGHGNVISTTLDLLRFDQALYAGKLLAPATLALATAPARLADGSLVSAGTSVDYGGAISYGLGWVLHEDPLTGKVVGHDGYNGGIATMLYRNVTNKQTVILFDNTVGEQFREKVAAVLGILQNQQPVALTIKESVARGYGAALLKDGPESALLLLNALRTDTLRYQLSEREMNVLGYELLFNGYAAHSLEAFKINTLLFPASFNVYDSYGDAFRAAGRHKEAILMYQKALALNPNSEGSKQALRLLQATPE